MQGLHGLRAVTGDYKGLQKTCSLTRVSPDTFSRSIFHRRVTRGSKGLTGGGGVNMLRGIKRGTTGLQGVTKGDKGLKKVTFGYSRLQEVTC